MDQTTSSDRDENLGRDPATRAFDFSSDALLLVDPHADRIVDANAAAGRLLGYDRALLLEMRFSALHPGQRPALIVFTQAALAKGSYWTHSLAPRHALDKELKLEYAATRMPGDPGPLLLLTLSDLNERRRRVVDAAAEDFMRGG